MPKRTRKQPEEEVPVAAQESDVEKDDSDLEDSDIDEINVDFEYFDPQPIDFHALKNLCNQLFGPDKIHFNTSELSDLILSQPLLGSTVKVDGHESDPYAFLTVLNMNTHQDKEVIKQLKAYILEKARGNAALHGKLEKLLSPGAKTHLGLVLSERLINMPPQIVPPMYRMLVEEIEWAVEDEEPYQFDAFLVFSKTYTELASGLVSDEDEDEDEDGEEKPKKKNKMALAMKRKKSKQPTKESFYYHIEDKLLQEIAGPEARVTFQYTTKPGEELDSYGIRPQGEMMLIPREEMLKAVPELEGACTY
ncbi:Mss4p nuclear export [Saitoella coloradoensis]